MIAIAPSRVALIHYTLSDDDGEVIESSRGGDPMAYLHGAGELVPGLERALEGCEAGDRIEVVVPPEEGYGVRSGRPPQPVSRDTFEGVEPQPGMPLVIENDDGRRLQLWVSSVSDDSVMLTPDHPLAGVTLHFHVDVMEVREATEIEVEQGHAQSGDGRTPELPAMPTARMGLAELSGTILEQRYELGRILGAGGMGAVFEARHLRLDRIVAIKVLRPVFADKQEAIRRFLREAQAASKIRHRNVVELLDYGETAGGLVYSVMEYLVGQDLQQLLRVQPDQRLPWSQACGLLVQIANGLKAAHGCGVIHRDVKPANCFLTTEDGEPVVKLVDFGIAKLVDVEQTQQLTGAAQVLGTPSYIAPELARDNLPASPRSDVYSFGVLAYRMLTGRLPFVGDTVVAVLMAGCFNPVPSMRALVPDLPAEVEDFVLELLAKHPDDRPQDMLTVRRRLLELSQTTMGPEAISLRVSGPISLDSGSGDSLTRLRTTARSTERRSSGSHPSLARRLEVRAAPVVERSRSVRESGTGRTTRELVAARSGVRPADPPRPRGWPWVGVG
ncbi:MAG: protein kinase, partial [Myxococcales bacterium]|nr:protein kinase [Myxococcales bacterium]